MSGLLPSKLNFGPYAVLDSALIRARHALGANPIIELIVRQVAQFKRRFPKGRSFFVRVFGNLGRLVVSDVVVEGRHQHQ